MMFDHQFNKKSYQNERKFSDDYFVAVTMSFPGKRLSSKEVKHKFSWCIIFIMIHCKGNVIFSNFAPFQVCAFCVPMTDDPIQSTSS